MLQETEINKTVLAQNTVSLLGPLHGKALRNPSPLFGCHVTCQARTSALYVFVVCPYFPFILGSFTFVLSFGEGKKAQSGLCLNGFAKQAVIPVHRHQVILPALGKKCLADQVSHYVEQQVDVYVSCKRTRPKTLFR